MSVGLGILFVFYACVAVQLFMLMLLGIKIIFYSEPYRDINHEKASVIMAAKNEAENLKKNLPEILAQKHSGFEVIVINDGSTDESADILQLFANQNPHLKIITLNESKGKKNAIETGIEVAQHEFLVFTDADCRPVSRFWLSEMLACFEPGKDLVIAYGPYESKPGLLNKVIRFDTTMVAFQYVSLALWGKPYMAVGRNMAYRKSLFYKAGKFDAHKHIKSGDDDLFVMTAATSYNTAVCLHPDTFVYSSPKETWADWIWQKSRHSSTVYNYKMFPAAILSLMNASFIGVYVFLAIATIWGFGIKALFFYLFLMANKLFIYSYIYRKLQVKDLWIFTPFLELIYIFAYFLIAVQHLIGSKVKWK